MSFDRRIARSNLGGWKTVFWRILAIASKLLHRNSSVCLVSDRLIKADDNGEYFFKWLAEHAEKNIKPYFVIKKGTSDYERMKQYGRVIDPDSREYNLLFLRAKYIVSSSFDDHVMHHFGKKEVFFRGLYDFHFVFLQHGIILHDMSRSVGRFKKHFSLFVTSAESERTSILSLPYYYGIDQVILSGLPRHDRLRNGDFDIEKRIVIAPTWRNYLVQGFNATDDSPIIPVEAFLESPYFKAYDSLLRDPRLLQALDEYGYSVDFVIHPGFSECAKYFTGSERVSICEKVNYNSIIERSAIMVTDFSSICFDFALMQKPVVYYQFDEDTFFSAGHCFGKGYFDYREDGFGPVFNDISPAVDYLIDLMRDGAKMEERYRRRAERFFFAPSERENSCSLIYNAMIKLDEGAHD